MNSSRIIRNTGYLYLKMAITMFITLYSTRLLLEALGVVDFGIFNVVGGLIAMLGFVNNSMAVATQRFMSFAEGEDNMCKKKSIFNISIVLHFFLAIIVGLILLLLLVFFFDYVFNIPSERVYAGKIVFFSLIISTVFSMMSVPYEAVINAHEDMGYYAVVGVFESVLKLFIAFIICWTLQDKLILYGILMTLLPICTLTIMRIFCHHRYKECIVSPLQYWNKNILREMVSFAGWNFIGISGSMIGSYGRGIILNHFFGVVVNAAYGIAIQINGQILSFTNNMLKALNPTIAKSEGSGETERMIRISLKGCKFSYYILAFFAIPLIIEMPIILSLWLKNVPPWAVVFGRLTLTNSLVEQMTIALGTSLLAIGNIKQFNVMTTVLNVVFLAFCGVLFILGFSPITMYVLNIIFCGVLTSCLKIYYLSKYSDMKYSLFMKAVFMPVVIVSAISFIGGMIPYYLIEDSYYRVVSTFIISIVSFVCATYYWGLLREEKNVLWNVLSNLKNKVYGRL